MTLDSYDCISLSSNEDHCGKLVGPGGNADLEKKGWTEGESAFNSLVYHQLLM